MITGGIARVVNDENARADGQVASAPAGLSCVGLLIERSERVFHHWDVPRESREGNIHYARAAAYRPAPMGNNGIGEQAISDQRALPAVLHDERERCSGGEEAIRRSAHPAAVKAHHSQDE